jgi:hypothetical protein
MSYYAKAGLITTTIDLTISSIQGNYANVSNGDVFQFSTTYDDSATYAQLAMITSLCLSSHIDTAGVVCAGGALPITDVNFLSNASSNISQLFDGAAMIAAGGSWYARLPPFNYSLVQDYVTGVRQFQLNNDRYTASLDLSAPNDPRRSAVMYYLDDFGSDIETVIAYELGAVTSGPATPPSVPEPSTLAIFALGMIGLASRRFKKQS